MSILFKGIFSMADPLIALLVGLGGTRSIVFPDSSIKNLFPRTHTTEVVFFFGSEKYFST
jgi:hypothetical protein